MINNLKFFLRGAAVAAQLTALALQESPVPSVVLALARGEKVGMKEKIKMFEQDCLRDVANNQTVPNHTPNADRLRVMTYNVHFWMKPDWKGFKNDPEAQPDHEKMIDVIAQANPDIVVLQEATLDGSKFTPKLPTFREGIESKLNQLGYTHRVWQDLKPVEGRFGNLIASKLPFEESSTYLYAEPAITEKNDERRGYVNVKIEGTSFYGTHLDVWDETEKVRKSEMSELLAAMRSDSCYPNVVLMGDLNAVRKQDHDYQIDDNRAWELLAAEDRARHGFDTPTETLDMLADAGYVDSFSKGKKPLPRYTVWSGKVVDFAMINNGFNKNIEGSYVYYDATSDHTPIIVDIEK